MASENQARLLGLPGVTGRIVTGGLADLVVLDDDLDVRGTMVGGDWVYRDNSLG
jgi:N-acetylglucosamine-6-phosphate deacetylase